VGEAEGCGLIKEQNLADTARQCLVKVFFRADKTPYILIRTENT